MSNPEFKDYFSESADQYAAHRPRYPVELAAYLASLTAYRQRALDVACGTGQLSVLLAAYFDQVIATDASPAQIANAEPLSNVDYRVAPAEQSRLPDQSVDLITVAQAAHWLNLDAFYQDAVRVAKPEAVLALISYGTTQVKNPSINQLVQYFYHDVVGAYWPPERQHIVDGYRHLSFPFKELNSPTLFMTAQWRCEQLIGYFNTWSAVTQAKKHGQAQRIEDFYQQFIKAWGDEPLQEIVWDITVRAARLASSDDV